MAADLDPHSLTHLPHQNPNSNPNPNPNSWMWNPRPPPPQEEDDSWEVRAFAQDTNSIMGATWPPRSYTCNFCRREFRSAQALGGHMNVHRRDRARLHQSSPGSDPPSPLIFPTQALASSGGALCLLYPYPTHHTAFTPSSSLTGTLDPPSTLLSISPYATNCSVNGLTPSCSPAINLRSIKVESSRRPTSDEIGSSENNGGGDEPGFEELDLELRLGQRP